MSYNTYYLNNDIYNYEYFLREDICRLCWRSEAAKDLYTETSNLDDTETKSKLLEMVEYCLDVSIASGSAPNKICLNCFADVDKFYAFKLFCQESHRRLREIWNTGCEGARDPILYDSEVEVKSEIDLDFDASENDIGDSAYPLSRSNSENSDDKPLAAASFSTAKRKYNKAKHPRTYCNKCHKDYKDGLPEHRAQLHGIAADGSHKCFGCEKTFRTSRTRMNHENKFCKGLRKGYLCTQCDRYLPKRNMYEAHAAKHFLNLPVELPEKIFKCRKCKITFATKETLVGHNEELHNRKKQHFVCELCGRVFRRLDYLKKHMMVHMGIKQHACPHCGYRTVQKSSLNVHLRKHSGDKPFSCDLCPVKCVTSSNLLAHKQRHAGLKKYQCALCPKKFGYKTSLEEHISSTHDRVKSFTCAICNTNYARSGGLRRHLRSKHNEKPPNDQVKETIGDISNCTDKNLVKIGLEMDEDDKILKIVNTYHARSDDFKDCKVGNIEKDEWS